MGLPDGNRRLTTRGVVYKPDIEKGIESYVDADFSGGWDQAYDDNAKSFIPRTGCVIMYVECPVLWCSKLQT